jgi:hypothetical protein
MTDIQRCMTTSLSNPKHVRVGEMAFFAGLLAFLMRVSDASIGIIK